jgi:hypothetical protein
MRTTTRRHQITTLIGCGFITTARSLPKILLIPSYIFTIPLLLRYRPLTVVAHALRSVAEPTPSPLYLPRNFSRRMDNPISTCGLILHRAALI